jgi:hypothetical protein
MTYDAPGNIFLREGMNIQRIDEYGHGNGEHSMSYVDLSLVMRRVIHFLVEKAVGIDLNLRYRPVHQF